MNQLINDLFNQILILVGPTAVGKSDYAVFLALLYDAEIINCDLMQIFYYGKIGTGHIDERDMIGIQHHLIGFLKDAKSISVYEMRVLIESKIEEILNRGKRVIIVGGSFFCVISLFFLPFSFYEKNYRYRLNSRGFVFDNRIFVFGRNIKLGDKNNILVKKEEIVFYPLYNYAVLEVDIGCKERWRQICFKRIQKFITMGMIEEYLAFPQEWKNLFIKKKIIGYYEIEKYLFVGAGKVESNLEEYLLRVFYATCQYGKKQRTFARKLSRCLLLYGILYKKYEF